ncbi:cullin 4A [Gongronella butleri]|nr:cullin 4A [Gongronella butleri]
MFSRDPSVTKRARVDPFAHALQVGEMDVATPLEESPEPEAPPPFLNLIAKFQQRSQQANADRKLETSDLTIASPLLPPDYIQHALEQLQDAISALLEGRKPDTDSETLYKMCEDLCYHDKGDELLEIARSLCQGYIAAQFAILESDPAENMAYLELVHTHWTTYCGHVNQIRCILLYLDRSQHPIIDMAKHLFADSCRSTPVVRNKVIDAILDVIKAERNGDNVDASLLRDSVRMLMDLELYESDFEPKFLDETRVYYKAEGDRLMNDMHMAGYLNHVATRVHQEATVRVKQYLDKQTKAPLTTIVEANLLVDRVPAILEKSFDYFMDNKRMDDLSLLYRLLQKVNKADACVAHFIDYIKTKGSEILCNAGKETDVFNALLSFMRKVDSIVDHSFENDETFAEGRSDSYGYIMNWRQNNTTSLLATYIDTLLRGDKLDDKLVDVFMTFFRLLQSKDTFEVLYKQDLAKRLIMDVGSIKAEKLVLARMKKESGAAYTSKLEKMLRDIKSSTELVDEFKADKKYHQDETMQLGLKILTYGFWPVYTPVELALPSSFQRLQSDFEKFYTSQFPKQRLTWQNGLSVCEVRAHYGHGTQNMTLTLPQTLILLLFNESENDEMTFGQILSATNLDELELRRTLKSLACGTHVLLNKMPPGADVEPTDSFTCNRQFEVSRNHLWMNTEKLKEAIDNNATVNQNVLFGRDQKVDAAIVRIMKARQQLTHATLLGEVLKQIKFPLTTPDVKKRIEVLIDKEFIARLEDGSYRYT